MAWRIFFGWPTGGVWSNLVSSAITFALGYLLAARNLTCSRKRCFRLAFHRVPATTYRTCHKHTTPEHHSALREQHAAKRPVQHAYLNGDPQQ